MPLTFCSLGPWVQNLNTLGIIGPQMCSSIFQNWKQTKLWLLDQVTWTVDCTDSLTCFIQIICCLHQNLNLGFPLGYQRHSSKFYTNIGFLESSTGLNPSVTDTCRLNFSSWTHGSLAAGVNNPPHSNGPPECGWKVACT